MAHHKGNSFVSSLLKIAKKILVRILFLSILSIHEWQAPSVKTSNFNLGNVTKFKIYN